MCFFSIVIALLSRVVFFVLFALMAYSVLYASVRSFDCQVVITVNSVLFSSEKELLSHLMWKERNDKSDLDRLRTEPRFPTEPR